MAFMSDTSQKQNKERSEKILTNCFSCTEELRDLQTIPRAKQDNWMD